MADARQSLKYFRGDHLSAKMFRSEEMPFARTIPVFDAVIVNGELTVTSASGPFSDSVVGFDVIVHAPNFGGAAHKSRIVSVNDATQALMADLSSVDLSGARADIGPDDTDVLLATLIPPGGNGSGIQRIIPSGCYLVRPGELVIPNPQSGILRGQGSRFNTIIRSNDPDSSAPVLTLGNGTFEPHSWVMEHLTVSKGYGPGPALYLNRLNLIIFRDVIITDLGTGGTGIDTPSAALLFGEMIFDHVSVYGGDGLGTGTPPGTIGIRIYATSNCTFSNCNIEAVDTAFVFEGVFNQCRLTMTGGHIETTGYHALILNNCQPTIDMEVHTGDVWLGNDVINGNLTLYNNAPSWANGGVVDNGFGNRIRRVSTGPLNQSGGIYNAGLSFDGDEWLRTASLNSDPLWLHGTTGWASTNASLAMAPVAMPGAKYGRALAIEDSGAGGGYAERTFTATADTDYLVQVGILQQKGIEHRIVVSDGVGTIWDSGAITNTYTSNDSQTLKVIRKRIPITSDTALTVRLYSPAAGKIAIYPMLLISKSAIAMETDHLSAGSGYSTSGSGADFTISQDLYTGTVYSFKVNPHPDLQHRGRCFFRAVVTAPNGASGAIISAGGGFASHQTGPQIILREGTHEYVIPLMSYPEGATVVFNGFITQSTEIDIAEIGLYLIDEDPNVVDRLKIRGRTMEAIDENGNIRLPVTTSFADEDRVIFSNLPADGTIKNPNIVALQAAGFGANQGTVVCVNSKFTGFPDYVQTSRVYSFTASSGSNTITIALDGYHYEGLNMPFSSESFVVMTTTAGGLSTGVNYWTKYVGGLDYELYDDDALTVRRNITSDGVGTMSQSPYAMFVQLAPGIFGVGFGDATNAGGVDPWTGDPDNKSSIGPPFLIVSKRNTSAVKETVKNSGWYSGYPIFPMFSGGGGLFFCSGDPSGQRLWSNDYPPIGSLVIRGDGKFSVRTGPIPEPDDGTGWQEMTAQLWTLIDSTTIATNYTVRFRNSDGSAIYMVVRQGGGVAIGSGYASATPTDGQAIVSNFIGVGASAPNSDEKFRNAGKSRLEGDVDVVAALKLSAQTASRAAVFNASKEVVADQIDLSSTDYVKNKLPIAQGGTNADTASGARTNLDVYSTGDVIGIQDLLQGQINSLSSALADLVSVYNSHTHDETGSTTDIPNQLA